MGGCWRLRVLDGVDGKEGHSTDQQPSTASLITLGLGGSSSARLGVEAQPSAPAVPRLALWSPYWLVNKTGLRLAYHLQRSQQELSEPTFDTGAEDSRAAAATGAEETLAGHQGLRSALDAAFGADDVERVGERVPLPLLLACEEGERLVVQVRR